MNFIRFPFIFFLALSSCYAIFAPVKLINSHNWVYQLPQTNISVSVTALGIVYLYWIFFKNNNIKLPLAVFSVLLSISHLVGRSFDLFDNFSYIWFNSFQLVNSLVCLIGFSALFYIFFNLILSFFYKIASTNISSKFKFLNFKFDVVFVLLFWLPVVLVYLPGTAGFDTFVMAIMWNGDATWTTHHPILPTIITGLMLDLGELLGNVNLGAGLLLVLNFFVIFLSIVLTLRVCYDLFPKTLIPHIVALYFAVIPLFPMYVQTLYKDSLNFAFTLLLTICIIKLLTDELWIKNIKNSFYLFILIVLVCLYRNTGIYLVIVLGSSLVFYLLKQNSSQKISVALIFLFGLFSVFMFNSIFISSLSLKPGSRGEMLSIPFQQTARYFRDKPNEISVEEFKAVDLVLPAAKLGQLYKPYISDPVKGKLKKGDLQSLSAYFKAWWSMGLKNPKVYISATIAGTYGYFYLDNNNKFFKNGLYTNITKVSKFPNNGHYNVTYLFSSKIRNTATRFLNHTIQRIPLLGMVYYPGVYTWAMLLMIGVLVQLKSYGSLIIFIPSVMTLLFCIASPVNGSVRYMLPIVASIPILLAWTLFDIKQKQRINCYKSSIH